MKSNICALPWIGIHTKTTGEIAPCCDFRDGSALFKGNPKDYRQSVTLKKIQESFLNNEWPKGCWTCKQQEEITGMSMRIEETEAYLEKQGLDDIDLKKLLDIDKFSYLKLVTSNRCNLGCIMCHPTSSSYLFNENYPSVDNPYNGNIDNKYISDMLDTIDNEYTQIVLQGGEPTIIKELAFIIEDLKNRNLQSNIRLEVVSNFAQYNKKWFDNLQGFTGKFIASVDAIGEQGEYIRYPSDWNKVEKNILQFIETYGEQFDFEVMPTLQILNIFYVDRLASWCNKHGIKLTLTNRLNEPQHFAVYNLPAALKRQAIKRIKKTKMPNVNTQEVKELINYINKPTQLSKKLICKELDIIDKKRKVDWKKCFPELIPISS